MGDNNEEELEKRLEQLTQDLNTQQSEQKKQETDQPPLAANWGFAGQIFSEFIAGVLVGAGLGWLFDKSLGTAPWGMIVLVILGFSSALWNIYLISVRMQDRH